MTQSHKPATFTKKSPYRSDAIRITQPLPPRGLSWRVEPVRAHLRRSRIGWQAKSRWLPGAACASFGQLDALLNPAGISALAVPDEASFVTGVAWLVDGGYTAV